MSVAIQRRRMRADHPQQEHFSKCQVSIGLQLFQHASAPSTILDICADRMRPTSWSGSRASVMEANVALLDELPGIEQELKTHLCT
jgi:hypothetical protein